MSKTLTPTAPVSNILVEATVEPGKLSAAYLAEHRKLLVVIPRCGVWFKDEQAQGKAQIKPSRKGDRSSKGVAVATTYGQLRKTDLEMGADVLRISASLTMSRKQFEKAHGQVDRVEAFEAKLPSGPFKFQVPKSGPAVAISREVVAIAIDTEPQAVPPAEGKKMHRLSVQQAGTNVTVDYAGVKAQLTIYAGFFADAKTDDTEDESAE